jgi:hypothetical protein
VRDYYLSHSAAALMLGGAAAWSIVLGWNISGLGSNTSCAGLRQLSLSLLPRRAGPSIFGLAVTGLRI